MQMEIAQPFRFFW